MEDTQTVDESGAVEQPAASPSGPLRGESRKMRKKNTLNGLQFDYDNRYLYVSTTSTTTYENKNLSSLSPPTRVTAGLGLIGHWWLCLLLDCWN